MKWSSVLKFAVIHLIALTLVSTFTTLLIGADKLGQQSSIDLIVYFQLPAGLVGIVVLVFFAIVQNTKTLLHLTITGAASTLFGFVILSALRGKLYYSPTWVIDLSVVAFTILVATYIGGYFRAANEKAT